MTAREQLRERVETLSEDEAADILRVMDQRADPSLAAFYNAPADDEPVTPDEDAAVAEANADIAAGRMVSLDEVLTEFGD